MYNLYIKYITEARTMYLSFYNSRYLNYQFLSSLQSVPASFLFSASAVYRFGNYKNFFYVPCNSLRLVIILL